MMMTRSFRPSAHVWPQTSQFFNKKFHLDHYNNFRPYASCLFFIEKSLDCCEMKIWSRSGRDLSKSNNLRYNGGDNSTSASRLSSLKYFCIAPGSWELQTDRENWVGLLPHCETRDEGRQLFCRVRNFQHGYIFWFLIFQKNSTGTPYWHNFKSLILSFGFPSKIKTYLVYKREYCLISTRNWRAWHVITSSTGGCTDFMHIYSLLSTGILLLFLINFVI